MAVKTYKTRSIQKAIHQIKKDLGPDALILSTRRIPQSPKDSHDDTLFEVSAVPHGAFEETEWEQNLIDNGTMDYVLDLSNRKEKKSETEDRSGKNAIKQELISIKEMLFLLNETQGVPHFFSIYPECLNIYIKLVKAGLSENRAQYFIKKGCMKKQGLKQEKKEVAAHVLKEIIKSISTHNPISPDFRKTQHDGVQLIGFIGPTGVGKTTTIAKLAADLSLKQKKKVGLISIDNFRIGAVEQLKTYAAIIGLPCVTAFTKEDIQKAARKMRTRDIVLVDTAGQNHLDKKRMEVLKYFLCGSPSVSSHLVLSATTKRQDMKEAAKHFSQLNPQTYIFTKIDETKQRGGIIDQVLDLKLPVSFVTNGQKVPEDIITATRKNISRIIFGN